VEAYRGFVFASLSSTGPTLDEHLGPSTKLIDRSCDLSPVGEVELTAGWVKHRCAANWKMLPENDSDGYHLGFVHMALFKSIRTQYQRVVGEEKSIKAVIREWGHGHIEIDWSPGYQQPFEWLGNASGSEVASFVAALERRDGPQLARRRIMQGPAHALIFPNLFLGETNIAIVEPVSVDECVHWHTPMFLKGVPEFNGRLLRMAEAGMGPASFLMPEDLIVASRNQAGAPRVDGRVAPARARLQPRVRGQRGARGLARDRRDDEPRALAALPNGDDRSVVLPDHVEFVYREARLADEARYAEWLALCTDDAVYWVPATTDPAATPGTHISHIYDNRARLESRIKLLQTGVRYSQEPASLMRRLVSNIEVTPSAAGELVVESNFLLGELSIQAKHQMHWWIGRTTHHLRRVEDSLRMSRTKVVLVNCAEPLPNLSFLI
jgi:3-phenylpropionate/cinnamic acid dioxygenase small subunit